MIRIRPMTDADVPFGLRLSTQAGWNQTEADWRRFLALQPDGCFVAECDGVPAGTTCCFLFGPVAWVGMVLVDQARRGRGIGTALMNHVLAFAEGRGVRIVRLDATPLGQPLYEKLGFQPEYSVVRYAGVPLWTGRKPAEIAFLTPEEPLPRAVARLCGDEVVSLPRWSVRDLCFLDGSVTLFERRHLWEMLHEEAPGGFRVVGLAILMRGALIARAGANAIQLGPGLGSRDERRMLLQDAQQLYAGQRVFIDVPLTNDAAVEDVAAVGLSVQRSFLRMRRGDRVEDDAVERYWATSGPETG